jgi:HAD superfamily hydrolase (TIGR01549 family)
LRIKAVLFDVIGTTVLEKDPAFINSCFQKAFNENNVLVENDFIRKNRGRDKMEIVLSIAGDQNKKLANDIYNSFHQNVLKGIHNFEPSKNSDEIFEYLKSIRVKIGLGTGLSRNLFEEILSHLQWNKNSFDYIGIANELGKGRPHPEMIFEMMKNLNIPNARHFVKVGDTVADIQEGKNAGVVSIAINSGTQPLSILEKENPDFIINNLHELRMLIK